MLWSEPTNWYVLLFICISMDTILYVCEAGELFNGASIFSSHALYAQHTLKCLLFFSHLQYASLLKQSQEKEQLAHMLRRNSRETIYESEIAGFNRYEYAYFDVCNVNQYHLQ